jgi:hypothetical protein
VTRSFPHRWYVRVRLHVVDEYPHSNGWAQHVFSFRTRLAARNRFDELRVLGELNGLDALVLGVWHRYPHSRAPARVELSYGSTGYTGKRHGEHVVE